MNDSKDLVVFKNSVPNFLAQIDNYKNYLEKMLTEGIISKQSPLYPATKLVHIQLINLTKHLTLIERLID